MQLFDKVIIEIQTPFGFFDVEFTIVEMLGNNTYVLISQKRLIIGSYKPIINAWVITKPIDLLEYQKNINQDTLCRNIRSK